MTTAFGHHPDSNSPLARKIVASCSERLKLERREKAVEQARRDVAAADAALQAKFAREEIRRIRSSSWRRVSKKPVLEIIEVVAWAYEITVADIIGCNRTHKFVVPRQEAFYRAWHERRDLSLTQIGRFFHRDYTTILHGIRAHAKRNKLPLPSA